MDCSPASGRLDLGFVAELPGEAISSVSVRNIDESTFGALRHLAPGLSKLSLGWTGLTDAVLGTVAELVALTYLQTFGNHFTDLGVQQLTTLQGLESLYLEEETLTVAAFALAARLPHLARLGVQDLRLGPRDLDLLRSRLPGVRVAD